MYKQFSKCYNEDMELVFSLRDGILQAELYTSEAKEPMELDMPYEEAEEALIHMGLKDVNLVKVGSIDPNNQDSPYGIWADTGVLS